MLRECEHKTTEEPIPTPFDAVPREFLYIKETYIDFDPYYTIVYKAHGVEYEGFGSFSISNISTYLRLYFIPQIEDKKRTSCSETPNSSDCSSLSSAQPEVIRCKDCKYWRRQTNYQGTLLSFGFCESEDMWCSLYGETVEVLHIDTNDDFYCGYAERRTDV